MSLVVKEYITHLENVNLTLENFKSTKYNASFSFRINESDEVIQYHLECIDNTILFEINGESLTEGLRVIGSKLYERVIESLRFLHKEKEWILSHYFILDFDEYEERKKPGFAESLSGELISMHKSMKHESMDDAAFLYFELEGIHELNLQIAGYDGYLLCQQLKKLQLADYVSVGLSTYQIVIKSEGDIKETEIKLFYAKFLSQYGYNVWVDYDEDR